jgi:hypothetical protein
LIKYIYINNSKDNEMEGTCGKYGGQERCVQGFGRGDLNERDQLEEPGLDGRIIFQ